MTVYEWIVSHPRTAFRVIRYVPAPDVVDDHGTLACGGEGESTVVYDSDAGIGVLSDLLRYELTTINDGDDGVPELEYMPDEYWI